MIIYVCHALFATSTGVNRSLRYLPKKPIFVWYTKRLECFLQPIPKVCQLWRQCPHVWSSSSRFSSNYIVKQVLLKTTSFCLGRDMSARDLWYELVTSGVNSWPLVWTRDLWSELLTSGMNAWPLVWTHDLQYELAFSGMNCDLWYELWPLVWTRDLWYELLTPGLTVERHNSKEYALIEIWPWCAVLIFGPITFVLSVKADAEQQW